MEFRPTDRNFRRRGFTLPEMMVGVAAATLVMLAVTSLYSFSLNSFASMSNYADFNKQSRNTSDMLSKDLRCALSVISATNNQLVLNAPDGTNITYAYNTTARTLTRSKGTETRTLSKDVSSVTFALYQRPATNSTYDQFPIATATNAKMVAVQWSCSRTAAGSGTDSEDVQLAIVNLRNQ